MERRTLDIPLLASILVLLGVGIALIYSDSPDWVKVRHPDNNSMSFFYKYLGVSIGGLFLLLVAAMMKEEFWRKWSKYIFRVGLGMCAVVATHIPKISIEHNGAHRWFNLGFMEFQPSELLKIGFILALALKLEELHNQYKHVGGNLDLKALKVPLLMWGFCIVLLLRQPNLSMCIMLTCIFLGMVYYAGANGKYILSTLAATAVGAIIFIAYVPYAHRRWEAFMGGDSLDKGIGLQQKSSLLVLGHGGVFGQGLGGGTQRLGFLPEPFSDMIYATLGEDFGLIGTSFVMLVIGFLVMRGIKISKYQTDYFPRFAALGFTLNIAANTLLHIGVCTKSMIPTGQPLPLVSNGGTNTFMNMIALGILLSFSLKSSELAPSTLKFRGNTR